MFIYWSPRRRWPCAGFGPLAPSQFCHGQDIGWSSINLFSSGSLNRWDAIDARNSGHYFRTFPCVVYIASFRFTIFGSCFASRSFSDRSFSVNLILPPRAQSSSQFPLDSYFFRNFNLLFNT